MKNILLLLALSVTLFSTAQATYSVQKPLRLETVAKGTKSDSVLVRGADKIVKLVPRSEIGNNADWNAESGTARILNKPEIIAPVNADWNATSGLSKILNKPQITPQVNADWNATSGTSQILNKPVIAPQVNADWNATNGISQILNKPVIAPQVNADWNATNGISQILNKPVIAPQVNADWNATSGTSQILNKPILATVSASGSYSDLTDKPSIPAPQVNADWNAVSGPSQILNKPLITSQINADWNQSNVNSLDFIKNKPAIPSTSDLSQYYIPFYNGATAWGKSNIISKPFTYTNYTPTGIATDPSNSLGNSLEVGSYNSPAQGSGITLQGYKNTHIKYADANAEVIARVLNNDSKILIASKNTNKIRTLDYNWVNEFNGFIDGAVQDYVTNLPSTARISELATGPNYYLAANKDNGDIYKITAANTFTVITNNLGFGDKCNIIFDSAGNFYQSNLIDGTIIKVTPAGVKSVFNTTTSNTTGVLDIDSNDNIYYQSGTSKVYKITPIGTGTQLLDTVGSMDYFVVDKQNCIMTNSGYYMQRYTSTGGLIEHYPLNGFSRGISDPVTGLFFGSSIDGGGLWWVNLADRTFSYSQNNNTSWSKYYGLIGYTEMGSSAGEADLIAYNGLVVVANANGVYFNRVNYKTLLADRAGIVSSGAPNLPLGTYERYSPFNDGGIMLSPNGVATATGSINAISLAGPKSLTTKEYLENRLANKINSGSTLLTINGTSLTNGSSYTISTSPNTLTTIPLTTSYSNSSTTRSTVTGWTFAVTAGKTYKIEIIGTYQTVVTTTGGSIGFILSGGGAGNIAGVMNGEIAQTTSATGLRTTLRAINSTNTTAGSFMTTTGVGVINSPHYIGGQLAFSCSTSGTFEVQFGSEIASSAAQLNSGSLLLVTEY